MSATIVIEAMVSAAAVVAAALIAVTVLTLMGASHRRRVEEAWESESDPHD